MAETPTPEQYADSQRFDIGAYGYRDADGKIYTINRDGKRVVAQNATALSPENQKFAEQAAAILMMQHKVLALTPQDRNTFMELINNKRNDLDASAGEQLQDAWKSFKKAAGFSMPGEGLMDGLSRVGAGAMLPFTFARELFGATTSMASQLTGSEISREDALAFGTAYASARQVAQEGRPKDYAAGVFSKDWWTYIKGGLSFGFDWVAGILEKLPVIGEWVQKQGWHHDKTLAQCVEECARDSDNNRVFHELTKLEKIGGLDTKTYGHLLAYGGVVRGVDGRDTHVAAADSNNAGPSTPGRNTPADAAAAAAKREQERKSFLERLQQEAGDNHFAGTAATADKAGWGGTLTAGALAAGAEYKTRVFSRISNTVVGVSNWGAQLVTSATTNTAAFASRVTGNIVGWVMPSSDGLQKVVDDAGEKAAKEATKQAKKAGLEGEALAAKVAEAKEAAREAAMKGLQERGAVSRAIDPLRAIGDNARDAGKVGSDLFKGLGDWANAKLDAIKSKLTFDTRSAAQKAADEALKQTAGTTGQAAAQVAAPAAQTVAQTTAHATVTAQTVAQGVEKAVPQSMWAKGTEKAAVLLNKIGAKKLALLLGAGGAAGAASARGVDGQQAVMSVGERIAEVTGANDVVNNGKPFLGVAKFADIFTWIGIPSFEQAVKAPDQLKAMEQIDVAKLNQISALVTAQTKATGNEYLDQVIKLKAMQARGVKEVAFMPPSSIDDAGRVLYEGKAIATPNYSGNPMNMITQPMTTTVSEMIKTNLQLYVVKGGDVAQAQALLGIALAQAPATGTLKADPAMSEAAVKATEEARKAQAQAQARQANKVGYVFASGTVAIGNGGIAPSAGSATGARSQVVPQPVV